MSRAELLSRIAREHGTPCFVYFLDDLQARIDAIDAMFGGRFEVSYAVKANPHPLIIEWLRDRVPHLDLSSGGELRRALAQGWEPSRLSFTGPGKREWELRAAAENGIGAHVVESVEEARRLDACAAEAGTTQPVLVRVAPKTLPRGFGVNMAGRPTQFGVDEEDLLEALPAIAALANLRLVGFHVYSGTQCLREDAIAENWSNFAQIFRAAADASDIAPERVVFGSGIGIPYHEGDESVDLARVAEVANPMLDALRAEPRFANTSFLLELGRYLVGEAGIYVTSVLYRKSSRGSEIAVCDGGMNHHLGACGHLGSVIHRNYRMFRIGHEPAAAGDDSTRAFELVGPLCTTIDTLGHGVELDDLEVGDLIGVRSSGAYGATASPINFISHEPARELFVETRDGAIVVTEADAAAAAGT